MYHQTTVKMGNKLSSSSSKKENRSTSLSHEKKDKDILSSHDREDTSSHYDKKDNNIFSEPSLPPSELNKLLQNILDQSNFEGKVKCIQNLFQQYKHELNQFCCNDNKYGRITPLMKVCISQRGEYIENIKNIVQTYVEL